MNKNNVDKASCIEDLQREIDKVAWGEQLKNPERLTLGDIQTLMRVLKIAQEWK